ncbi:MAG TPA: hypothetical protein VLV49_03345 [Terriglobales bacterium]|nr:hypothetical protein [Terriglobales bacterium]
MAASQVVLYFDREEDALRFTLAASSVMSEGEMPRREEAGAKIAREIRKATRITAEGALSSAETSEPALSSSGGKCA